MPSVSISRSRFAKKSQHKTSFDLGQIIPIYCDEILPGSTKSFDMASLVRMSTPIAPIMDNIYLDLFAFFVPNRLVWEHWKAFMGENETSAGIPAVSYSIPYIDTASHMVQFAAGSYGDYLGLPVGKLFNTNSGDKTKISALPFRGLALIYNEWFRNQNVTAPLAIQKGDTNEVLVGSSSFAYDSSAVLSACKLSDYFTKSLPYAQKGAPVMIGMTGTAPIVTGVGHSVATNAGGQYIRFGDMNGTGGSFNPYSSSTYLKLTSQGLAEGNTAAVSGDSSQVITATNLVADLSQATATTINQIRYAFQLQKLLEKDALYGSNYWQVLAAHFGVLAPDASLQRPEYLGGKRIRINIDQVLSQAGYDDSASTLVGAPGANSVTGDKASLFTKSFVEHGFIFVLAVARQEHTYHQGINKMWTRQGRYDFYWPVFANLGAQSVLNREIYAQGSSADELVFGYQEAWAEYRYKPSIATGKLRPTSGNLDFWTLTDNFASLPTLSDSFVKENRANIQRALVSGSSGPDFIADFWFNDISVLPMPTYSIPGLVDHH